MRQVLMFFALVLSVFTLAHAQFTGGGGGETAKAPLTSEELQKRCDGGNAIACDDLGIRYLKGEVVAKDLKKSATLFQRACDGGDAVGCYDMAESYRFGDGVAKDSAQAATFYQRGCDGKNANSCAELALLYDNGDGVKQDDGKAALYADRSCDGGSSLGCTLLAAVYAKGTTGYPKDMALAESLLGAHCADGYEPACKLYEKLTGQKLGGDEAMGPGEEPAALNNSPTMPDQKAAGDSALYTGITALVGKDFTTAANKFAEACDFNNVLGCGQLGDMYLAGNGLPRSGARAAPLLARACDGAVTTSCEKLGQIYDNGDGVAVNKARAFTLYDGACSQSVVSACYNLGRLYESGQGTIANVAQAATLYQQACNTGFADACLGIGSMYANGVHFAKNEGQALAYYKSACTKGGVAGCQKSTQLQSKIDRSIELQTAKAAAALPALTAWSSNCSKASEVVNADPKLAEQYARLGIKSNDPACIHVMGYVHELRQDYELAFAYYDNAARKNVASSVHNIGGFYSNGYYLKRDYKIGIAWYERARILAESQGNSQLVALANENIANNKEAMRPVPVRQQVCRTEGTGTTQNPDGSGGQIYATICR